MTAITSAGIVGGGLIGMSWASLFLARGLQVSVVDPDPAAKDRLAHFVAEAWPNLKTLGLATTDVVPSAQVTDDFTALSQAQFIQENGPDRIAAKRDIIARIESVVAPDVVIASSTSSLMATDIQAEAVNPDRILVAHPMNPPHLVPMVELVAGDATSHDALLRAEAFYEQLRRVTIRVKKEVPGHLANRLTAALYREAVYLVAEGIADVDSVDKAIAYGPGMRWAFMGPHLTYHLGGGPGGYRHYLEHLGPTQEARWSSLGSAPLTDALVDELVAGVAAELANQDEATLIARRDAALVELAQLKRKFGL